MDTVVTKSENVIKLLERDINWRRLDSLISKSEAMIMDIDAIPLEQLKGDIARAGHPVQQTLALDADNHRLFFTDIDGQHLYADFGGANEGYRVNRIGHQASIAKEYDVIDLEPSKESGNLGESVTTTNEEEDDIDTPGVYPGGTPTVKPEEDDRGYSSDEKEPTRKELITVLKKYVEGGDDEDK